MLCSCFFSYSYSVRRGGRCSYSYSKRSSIAIRPIGPQVAANGFDQRSELPQFKKPSSTSTVSLSTASLSTSTTKSDARHERRKLSDPAFEVLGLQRQRLRRVRWSAWLDRGWFWCRMLLIWKSIPTPMWAAEILQRRKRTVNRKCQLVNVGWRRSPRIGDFGRWAWRDMRSNAGENRARAVDSTQVRTAVRGLRVHRFVRPMLYLSMSTIGGQVRQLQTLRQSPHQCRDLFRTSSTTNPNIDQENVWHFR